MVQKSPGGGAADSTVTPFREINADSAQRRIADDLRAARMARGLEVADAARSLRIRAVYLAALEEGRFADLPGPTYVAGFLRAYGRFLDLDGDELVRRFKDESGGVLVHQQLNFPVPASEARHPTGFMIAAALIVALAVAGAWYAAQERGVDVIELVPEVPEEIVEAAQNAEAATTGQDLMATEAEKELADDLAADIASPEAAEDVQGEMSVPEAGDDEVAVDAPAEEPAAAEAAADAAAEPEAVAEAAEATVETAGAEETAVPADEAGVGESGDLAASEAEITAENGYVPRVYGRTNTDSRVEVRAIAETWIQVEGPGNEILLTRVLLPGDIYRVPNRDDVTLDTGNAGGLELRVDGALIAPLGAPGIVIRNVSLAPGELLSR
jgi:cytoskeleton protein RodZ